MKLRCTDTQHHHLWAAYNAAREGTTTLKVDKAALWALLDDHATLVGAAGKQGVVVTEP